MCNSAGLLRRLEERLRRSIPECLTGSGVVVVAAAGAGTGAGQAPSAVPGAGVAAGGGLPDLGGLAGLGLPDMGALGGGGLLDPALMQQMLQNPQIQQMMQGLLSNPAYMNQVGVWVFLASLCGCCPATSVALESVGLDLHFVETHLVSEAVPSVEPLKNDCAVGAC